MIEVTQLPAHARYLDGVALILIVSTAALLIAPGIYHQIESASIPLIGGRVRLARLKPIFAAQKLAKDVPQADRRE